MSPVIYRYHPSPIGPLLLAASERGLRAVYLQAQRHVPDAPDARWVPASPSDPVPFDILERTAAQLDAYFAGARATFDVPHDVVGTPFQHTVWTALRAIGFGETLSYGELARRIGNPGAVRAVGLANGRNPLSIVVPCHRVIGADGSMTGYGGGVERKVFLLELERKVVGARSGEAAPVRGGPQRAFSRQSGF